MEHIRKNILRIELGHLEALLRTAAHAEADMLYARKMQILEELGLNRPSDPKKCKAA